MAGLRIYPIPGFSDPVSSLTHIVGAGVFAFLTPLLLRRGRGSASRQAYLGVFAFATVFLLSMSGVYHLLSPHTAGRAVLQRLDHGAIFVLIAGTFTPLHGIVFRGMWRWCPLLLVWAAAFTGITLKTIFFNDLAEWMGLLFYLGLGWVGAITGAELLRRFGWAFIRPLFWGGVAYSVGGVLEFLGRPVVIPGVVGPHELFHIAVLVGVSLHWKFVAQFASGEAPPLRGEAGRLPGG